VRQGKRELHDVGENVKNHAVGTLREKRNALREGYVDDDVLVERVRAELGHKVESARTIEVFAENGCVTLGGSAMVHEIDRAEKTAKAVRGVTGVNNELVPIELTFDG
jgi:osmotically-inducible protein OsmY